MGEAASIAERTGRRVRAAWRRRAGQKDQTPSLIRLALRAGLALAATITIALVLVVWLSSISPAWWRGAVTLDGVAPDVGERVERAIISETHRAREPDEPWTMAITQEQANAWLRDRLPKWASNRGARAATTGVVRVRFEQDAVAIGVQQRAGGRVYCARFAPSLRPDGSLWSKLLGVSAGRMPAPSRWAIDALASVRAGAGAPPAAALTGAQPALAKTEFRLDDGRVLRPREVRVEPGRLVILWETVAAPRARAGP